MANKTLKTRVQLKYDTYKNWHDNNPTPLAGEVCVVVVPAETGAVVQEPAILYKVGDGTNNFRALSFASAKAADVYDWAKASTKPEYKASEIKNLSDFISGEIQDTNTTYKIEVDATNPRKFTLYAKDINGEFAAQNTVTIPAEKVYNLVEGTTNGTVKFNETEVKVHGLDTAAYKKAEEFDAAGAANTALESAKEYTNQKIGEIPEQTDYTVRITATTPEGVAKRYNIKQTATNLDFNIDIPKDMVVKSGTVETKATEGAWGAKGTYLHLVLANATEDNVYINVDSLIEYVTSGSKAGDMVYVSIDANHKVTATITDGTITLAKLATDVQTKINQAHAHTNKTVLDGITAQKVSAWDAKIDDSDLAAIAKSGNVNDLVQTAGDYLIFNCGDASSF